MKFFKNTQFQLGPPYRQDQYLGDPPLFVSLKIDDPPPVSAGPPPVLYYQSLSIFCKTTQNGMKLNKVVLHITVFLISQNIVVLVMQITVILILQITVFFFRKIHVLISLKAIKLFSQNTVLLVRKL